MLVAEDRKLPPCIVRDKLDCFVPRQLEGLVAPELSVTRNSYEEGHPRKGCGMEISGFE